MATIRKNITVSPNQDAWVKAQIAAGRYTNESELYRDLVRQQQAREDEIEIIRSALIEGENSGISSLTPEDVRQRVLARLIAQGKLDL